MKKKPINRKITLTALTAAAMMLGTTWLSAGIYRVQLSSSTTAWDDVGWIADGEGAIPGNVPGVGDTARVRGLSTAGATNMNMGRNVEVENLEAYATQTRLRSSSNSQESLIVNNLISLTNSGDTQLHFLAVGDNNTTVFTVSTKDLLVGTSTMLVLRRDPNASLMFSASGNSTNNGTIQIYNSSMKVDFGHMTNNGLLDLAASTNTVGETYEVEVASLAGSTAGVITNQFDAFETKLRIAGANASSTNYEGVINDRGGDATTAVLTVTKDGAGVQIFSGANTYSAGTTINAGTLLANNTTGSGLGTGDVIVNSGATLGGSGRIALGAGKTITVADGAILAAGDETGFATLDLVANGGPLLIMEEGAEFTFKLGAGNQSDTLSFHSYEDGVLVLNNNRINVTGIQAGNFKLFEFDSSIADLSQELQFGDGFDGWDGLYSLSYQADSIYLVVVPETETYGAALGLIVLGALVLRFRNRRAVA